MWTWTALDPNSKLIVSWLVGERTEKYAECFMRDFRSRVRGRFQLTTDNCASYIDAVYKVFGEKQIDYAQIVKAYGADHENNRNHSKESVVGQRISVVCGNPISPGTSHVERHNLTIRQNMKRYMRKTNGFSKRLTYHNAMVSLFMTHYNFCRIHGTSKITPAMEAGLEATVRDCEWIVGLIDERTPAPGPRGPYKKRKTD